MTLVLAVLVLATFALVMRKFMGELVGNPTVGTIIAVVWFLGTLWYCWPRLPA